MLTSAGAADPAAADGQRAQWVAVAFRADDAWRGLLAIAVADPPPPWRVDGQYGFGPSRCIAGAWSLARGASAVESYRFAPFTGAPERAALDDLRRSTAP